jgi:chromosomal replication initiation ATPase DnaA
MAFEFSHAASYRPDDFIVNDGNRDAYAWVEGWPDAWPTYGLVVTGAKGSGKTHLAHIWAMHSGARWLDTSLLTGDLHQLLQRHRRWVIDGLETWPDLYSEPAWEQLLFHFLNLLSMVEGSLLITSTLAPARMEIRLPDLASRLRMLPVASMEGADESELAQLLVKLLHDRQWHLSQEAVAALLSCAERTPSGVQSAVERLESCLMHNPPRVITPSMVRLWLDT